MKTSLRILFLTLLTLTAQACIWDSDTLSQEQAKSPEMAELILGKSSVTSDPVPLRERIKKLEADPRKDDPAWWNELAGAHLRLGEAQEAADLLELVLSKFPDDYGFHANLGTAYHLLGRYQEAEKEIARDLELNPDGHFGLEKYHLALLQYLIRNPDYQSRHVFVDEFTCSFLEANGPLFFYRPSDMVSDTNSPVEKLADLKQECQTLTNSQHNNDYKLDELCQRMTALDVMPAYRTKWNLGEDTNFLKGIVYMATLNRKEPACFVMLGIASWQNRDLNLAAKAFEQAVELGSPQSEVLKRKVEGILHHIEKAKQEAIRAKKNAFKGMIIGNIFLLIAIMIFLVVVITIWRSTFSKQPHS